MFLDVTTLPGNDFNAALVNALIPVFLTVTTAVIGFVGAAVRGWVKAHTTDAQVNVFQRIAVIGVQAAEQLYGEFEGQKKFDYAKAYIEAELAKRGVHVDEAAIEAAIESAVLEQFNWPEVKSSTPGEQAAPEVPAEEPVINTDFPLDTQDKI